MDNIIKEISKKLRKDMTYSEKILWDKLKAKRFYNLNFVKQFPVYVFTENSGLDRYVIPDFLCRKYKIIIELDGSIHNIKEIYELDQEKEKLLKHQGYKIIRLQNEEIINKLDQSLEKIAASFSF